MRRALVLQYVGTHYAGWQAQENALAIQTVVESALARLYEVEGGRLVVRGAARTDAGVHALMQVAHFDPPFAIPEDGLRRGLNDHLPRDVRVARVEEVSSGFDALRSAIGKTYVYRLWRGEVRPPFLVATTGRGPRDLDVERMREAARRLPGRRDLALFSKTGSDRKTSVRELTEVAIEEQGDLIVIRVSGEGFLRGTVRLLAGTLAEVGRGRLAVEVPEALLAGDATAGRPGPALEASGLFLWRVDYGANGPAPEPPPPSLW